MINSIAKYQIEETFKITDRGIVFTGTILDGEFTEIRIGNWLTFQFNNEIIERKIIGIDAMRATSEKPNIGILIKCIDANEIEALQNWNPKATIAKVFEKNN